MKLFSALCISLFILLSFNINAKSPSKKMLDENYVFKGDQNIKYPYKTGLWGTISTHSRIHQNPWALRYDNEVSSINEYSLRFEKRLGDCGTDDCDRTEKKFIGRSEVGFFDPISSDNIRGHLGEHWYSWSFLIHPDSDVPTKKDFVHMGQFKMSLEHEKLTRKFLTNETIDEFNETCPEMNFFLTWRYDGIHIGRSGVHKCDGDSEIIIDQKTVKGQWHHVLLNINWTDEEDGKIKLWVNDKLVYQKNQKTISKIVKNKNNKKMGPVFRFGIYSQGENGDQVFYYDNLKALKTCEKFREYNCESLREQNLVKTIQKSDPDDGTLIVGQFETNDDPEKRKRIIKTLINKITKNIMKKSNSSKNDIENWVRAEIEKLNWDKDLDKGSDRKKIRDKLTKKGIKKFK